MPEVLERECRNCRRYFEAIKFAPKYHIKNAYSAILDIAKDNVINVKEESRTDKGPSHMEDRGLPIISESIDAIPPNVFS